MRALLLTSAFVVLAPALADPPAAKKDDPPHVLVKFLDDHRKCPDAWVMTFEMATASGAVYELSVEIDSDKSTSHLHMTERAAMKANWLADPSWENSTIAIYGVRTKETKGDPIKSLKLTNRVVKGQGILPHIESVGDVKIATAEADPKAKPVAKPKPLPTGPHFGPESAVEFDLSTLPPPANNVSWDLCFKIRTAANNEVDENNIETDSGYAHDGLCELLAMEYNQRGFKAEAVGKTTLRLYGGVYKDHFYPATKGEVTSPDLKPADLPKVTNPKRL